MKCEGFLSSKCVYVWMKKQGGRTAVLSGDCVLHSRQEKREELFNSCYLRRSAGDNRGGGANAAKNEHLRQLSGVETEINFHLMDDSLKYF